MQIDWGSSFSDTIQEFLPFSRILKQKQAFGKDVKQQAGVLGGSKLKVLK
jgi:hypothetical protein